MTILCALIAFLSACVAMADLGKSTYAMSHPFEWMNWAEDLLPTARNLVQENSTESCVEWVKLCVDDGDLDDCHGPNGNFQLHSVGAYLRESGTRSMEELESLWTDALDGFQRFDPVMDSHVSLYTEDLDYYINSLKTRGTAYLAGSFSSEAGDPYYTVTVQAAGSMQVLDLVGDNSSITSVDYFASNSASGVVHQHTTPRATDRALKAAVDGLRDAKRRVSSNGKPVLRRLHVSYMSADLNSDIKFFEDVLMGKKVGIYQGADPSDRMYAGVLQSGDAGEVHFVQRGARSGGELSQQQWIEYFASLHDACITDDIGFDRLADFHIGHAMGNANLDSIIAAVEQSGAPYRFFGQPQRPFFYVYMPNGQGVQLIGTCTGCPRGGGYDFCNDGIIGSCKATPATAPAGVGIAEPRGCGDPATGPVLGGVDLVQLFNNPAESPQKGLAQYSDKSLSGFRFLSDSNREAFAADPEKYAPQLGGYCSWGISGFDTHSGSEGGLWYSCTDSAGCYEVAKYDGKIYFYLNQGAKQAMQRKGDEARQNTR